MDNGEKSTRPWILEAADLDDLKEAQKECPYQMPREKYDEIIDKLMLTTKPGGTDTALGGKGNSSASMMMVQ